MVHSSCGLICGRQVTLRDPSLICATSECITDEQLVTEVLLVLLHPFNSLFSRTTWVSWHHKGITSLDLNEARDAGVSGWQWHQLDHMQTICTLLQTDNHINTSSLNFYRPGALPDDQQCQSTDHDWSAIQICNYRTELKVPTPTVENHRLLSCTRDPVTISIKLIQWSSKSKGSPYSIT